MFIGLGFKFDTIPSKSFRLAEASRTRNRPSSNQPMPRVISPIASDAFSGSELIIVQGLENVRPGVPVQASPMPQSLNRS